MAKLSEEQKTVRAAQNGDAESFGVLYVRHYAAMVWLAYSILLDRDAAEDAAQQTFVKACEKLAGLRRTDRFGPWLARICRNEAIQSLRNRKRQTSIMPDEPRQVETSVSDRENHDSVKLAVDRLAPMYREVVVLRYYNRMDYRQIAAMLGIAEHTVRGRLFRARRRIEQTLRSNGFPKG